MVNGVSAWFLEVEGACAECRYLRSATYLRVVVLGHVDGRREIG
jgi:hypothetical protein